jgi:hypothetical protein
VRDEVYVSTTVLNCQQVLASFFVYNFIMKKIFVSLLFVIIMASSSDSLLAQNDINYNYRSCSSCPIDPCEKNYTLNSYYKTYLYGPTFQIITARISIEPAEFLDTYSLRSTTTVTPFINF